MRGGHGPNDQEFVPEAEVKLPAGVAIPVPHVDPTPRPFPRAVEMHGICKWGVCVCMWGNRVQEIYCVQMWGWGTLRLSPPVNIGIPFISRN